MVLSSGLQELLISFSEHITCPVCLYIHKEPLSLPCNHCFCKGCIERALKHSPKCPICKQDASKRMLRKDEKIGNIINGLKVLLRNSQASNFQDEDDAFITQEAKPPKEMRKCGLTKQARSDHAAKVSCSTISVPTSNSKQPELERPPGALVVCSSATDTIKQTAEESTMKPFRRSPRKHHGSAHFASTYASKEHPKESQTDNSTEISEEAKKIHPGDIVDVAQRTWPGMNKLGGRGFVTNINENDQTCDVRYVLGGKESKIPLQYVVLNENSKVEAAIDANTTGSRQSIKRHRHRSFPGSFIDFPFLIDNISEEKKKSKRPKSKSKSLTSSKKIIQPKIKLLGSGLCPQKFEKLDALSKMLDTKPLLIQWDSEVTHLIVLTQKDSMLVQFRSIKYLLALLSGCWIVSFDWVTACLDAGKHVPEEPFEIVGDRKSSASENAPRRSRLAKEDYRNGKRSNASLFPNYIFYFHDEMDSKRPPISKLKQFATLGGAQVIDSMEQFVSYVDDKKKKIMFMELYKFEKVKSMKKGYDVVDIEWFMECVASYNLAPLSEYLLL